MQELVNTDTGEIYSENFELAVANMETMLAQISTVRDGMDYEQYAQRMRDALIIAGNVVAANKAARCCCEGAVIVGELLGVDVEQGDRTDLTLHGSERLAASTATKYRNMARVPVELRYNYYEKQTDSEEIISKAGLIKIWKGLQKTQKQEKKKRKPKLPPMGERYSLYRCSCEDLIHNIPAESQQWIITDPPYPKEYLSTFSELSSLANHALVDGGLMIVMSGQSYLPEVISRLGECMTYHWCGAYLTPGGQSAGLHSRRVNTFWKPLLIYSKGKYKGHVFGDVSKSDVNDNDKLHHEWGQSVTGMNDIIERFTMPGDTIVDPFLGGGTTCLSALGKDRLFIGCDIEQEHINETLRRIEHVS